MITAQWEHMMYCFCREVRGQLRSSWEGHSVLLEDTSAVWKSESWTSSYKMLSLDTRPLINKLMESVVDQHTVQSCGWRSSTVKQVSPRQREKCCRAHFQVSDYPLLFQTAWRNRASPNLNKVTFGPEQFLSVDIQYEPNSAALLHKTKQINLILIFSFVIAGRTAD